MGGGYLAGNGVASRGVGWGGGEAEETVQFLLHLEQEGEAAQGAGGAGGRLGVDGCSGVRAGRYRAIGVGAEEVAVALGLEDFPGGGEHLAEGGYGFGQCGGVVGGGVGHQLVADGGDPVADGALGHVELLGDGGRAETPAVERPGVVAQKGIVKPLISWSCTRRRRGGCRGRGIRLTGSR